MKHGMIGTRIYNIWKDMKKRCYCKTRKDYARYGGRGITVCKDWQDFIPFYNWAMSNGYSDDLTLDRKNVNGNYEPSNCRWATRKEQQNNRRCNHLLTYNGKTQTITQWAEEYGIAETTLYARLTKSNMTFEQALSKSIGNGHERLITFNGLTMNLKQWAEHLGISKRTLDKRLNELHWDIERALTTK